MPRRSRMRSIDGRSLDLEDVIAVARDREAVRLAPAAAKRVDASRRALEKIVAKGTLAYGIKTGFGDLASVAISEADVRTLQLNLLRSHAIGQGPPLRRDEVRAAILLRANTLAMGYSGVRRVLVTRLLDFLNRGVHPVIPSRGSLGASGDLAPLAHLGLVLVGEGEAEVDGQVLPGAKALAKAKLDPLVLQSKEGLAIINGTSVMAAVGAVVVNDGLRLLKDAEVAASMSFEALRGSPKPFDDRLVGLKPQPGAREVAANLRRLLRGSEIIPSHRGPHKVQDPYTLRCIPQVLGAVRATLDNAVASLRIEMNAATDNPLIFPEGTSVSGGNFHAQALAMALDHVALGMAVVQYVAAGYASDNKVLAHPASADSIPTSANQEDFVPMGMAAALKARQSLENAARVVALEVLAAAQGLEFLKPLRAGVGPRAAHAFVRSQVPPLVEDRSLAADANRILEWMATGEFLKAVEAAAGPLA